MNEDSESRPASLVDHTYRDFSRYLEEGGKAVRCKKQGRNFPAKLHQMCSEPRYSDIIAWMVSQYPCETNSSFGVHPSVRELIALIRLFLPSPATGRAFRILDKGRLMSEAVPDYFTQKRFASFTRQLSGWGFKRLHRPGQDYGCYYHELFLRGLPKLTSLMVRIEGQGKPKSTPNPGGEPDFYRISRQHPVPPVDQSKRAPSHSGSAKMPRAGRSTPHITATTIGLATETTSTSAASSYEAMNWNAAQQATQQPTLATLQSSETALPAAAASMASSSMLPYPQIPAMDVSIRYPQQGLANLLNEQNLTNAAGAQNVLAQQPNVPFLQEPSAMSTSPAASSACSDCSTRPAIYSAFLPQHQSGPPTQSSFAHAASAVPTDASVLMQNYQALSAAFGQSSGHAYAPSLSTTTDPNANSRHGSQASAAEIVARPPGQQGDPERDGADDEEGSNDSSTSSARREFKADMLNLFDHLQKDM
ncbi:hypothetical protein ACHAXT_003820 [Thalassiosira profunda]